MIEEQFWEDASFLSCPDGDIWIGFGKREWHEKEPYGPSFFISDFFLCGSKPWCTHPFIEKLSRVELLTLLSGARSRLETLDWENDSSLLFEEAFEFLQKQFSKKKLKKAVPYIREAACCRLSKDRKAASLEALLEWSHSKPLYVYGFWEGEEGLLGATPEKIAESSEEGIVRTVACAGTHQNPEVLLRDVKLLNEHQIVVEGILSSLSGKAEVQVQDKKVVNAGAFFHLITPITLKLNRPYTWIDVLNRLHPTPALGAYPKDEGKKWLMEYDQKLPRRYFAAPFGFLSGQLAFFVAAIRGAEWQAGTVSLFAGCGITPESKLQEEKDELELKLKSIKQALKL